MQEAVSGFATLWEQREAVEEDSEDYVAVLEGGVLLAAYALAFGRDNWRVNSDAIRETVAPHRDRLSGSVQVLFDFLDGETPDADPDGEYDFEDFEAWIVAAVLDTIQADGGQATNDDTTEQSGSPEVREDYRAGLRRVVAGDDQRARSRLLDVWDEWPVAVSSGLASCVLGGGVALAVLVRDDPGLSSIRQEVVEAVDAHGERLPEAARPVADCLLEAGSDQSLESPDPEGELADCPLETVEQVAFADLLARR